MKIANHVEMLEITDERGTIYPVLIWDEHEKILIDTGFPGQTKLLEAAIKDTGFSIAELTKIILTHQDIDHIGNAKDFIQKNPSIQLLVYKEEAPYIEGEKMPVKMANMEKALPKLTPAQQAFFYDLKKGFEDRQMTVDVKLSDGDLLEDCGGIKIIHTPGHTPGHICLLLQESKILVAGDALNIIEGKLSGPNPQYSHDIELAQKSADAVVKEDIYAVVCYHGGYQEI